MVASQTLMGMVRLFEMFCKAMNTNFSAASVVGKDCRLLVTFRIEQFTDSIVLVV